ncbi:MAG: trehalose-phosphatase [Actinomycetia bacterium]|nr:trehalose-phosphatase [Actinomycetes bacterium]MCH9800956.1 trehalose-phosphatase [Actinomycetes bacterium]
MTLPESLRQAISRAAASPRLLSCWDFDGTLAPIVSDPQAARPLPGAVSLLQRLAELPDTEVALLSGRARADLARLSGVVDPILQIGCHGAELPAQLTGSAASGDADLLQRVVAAVGQITTGATGSLLETKPVSVAVHVRNVADRQQAQQITEEVIAGPGSWSGVHITTGKEVVELSVARGDKGAAISLLRQRFNVDLVTFIGDDVTDERGFAVLSAHDLGIKVGEGDTAASFRVATPDEVMAVLELLLKQRSESVTG